MNKVYQIITDKIVEQLEAGTVAWHKPWKTIGGPRNLQSKRPYRGINAFLLAISPFVSPYWTTYNAATKMGGQVRKGEKSTVIVFWKKGDDYYNEEEERYKPSMILRYYRVFNVEQIDWNDEAQVKIDKLNAEAKQIDFEPMDAAQAVIDEMQNAPTITHLGGGASYNWLTDDVNLPPKDTFESVESYYGTAYHELAHSTAHESRLHRIKDWSTFGSDPYGKEELVAEMTSAFICGSVGIDGQFEATAAYLAAWLKIIKGDPTLIVSAAAQAQKAADYILNISFEQESTETPAEKVAA
jgi:antirestriction protein ArdC